MHRNKQHKSIEWLLLSVILSLIFAPFAYCQDKCVGWATTDGSVTGGEGGTTIVVTDSAGLLAAVKAEGKRIIKIKGKVSCQRVSMSGKTDITFEGAEKGAELVATFYIGECSNLIFRNLIINAVKGGQMDIFCIEESSHHIWIDHCDISDNRSTIDGLVDMTHGCDNITISWNKFHYPDSIVAHRFAMLISHSDDAGGEDSGKERITIHHNWWAENIEERMPRARFGQIHVFNNYYNSIGNNYCIGPGKEAKVVAESNYFDNVNNPHIFFDSVATAQIRINTDNYYAQAATGRKDVGQGDAFVIPYPYTLDAGADVKRIVMSGAGPFNTPVHVFGNNKVPLNRVNFYAATQQEKAYTIQGARISANAKRSALPVVVKKNTPVLQLNVKSN